VLQKRKFGFGGIGEGEKKRPAQRVPQAIKSAARNAQQKKEKGGDGCEKKKKFVLAGPRKSCENPRQEPAVDLREGRGKEREKGAGPHQGMGELANRKSSWNL